MNLRYEILKNRRSRIHLQDLILILKCLYPHRSVHNPFEEQIYYQTGWTTEQKALVSKLVYASCLFNQKYRTWDKWMKLQAEQEDYINAIALAQRELDPKKPMALLDCSSRRTFIEIFSSFGLTPFTSREVRNLSYMSKSHVHRCLQDMISTGLVEIVGGCSNKGYQYQLTEKALK